MKFFKKQKNSGFTLVELIVVIAILAILAAVAYPVYTGYIKKANEAADLALLGTVNEAFRSALIDKAVTGLPADATVELQGDKEGKTISAIDYKVTEEDEEPTVLTPEFMRYFKGNENTKFKVYTALSYNELSGTFAGVLDDGTMVLANGWKMKAKDNGDGTKTYTVTDKDGKEYTYTLDDKSMEDYGKSTFGQNMSASGLMGEIDNVAETFANFLNGPFSGLADNFAKALGVNLDKSDPDYYKKLGNALVLGVAEKTNSDAKSIADGWIANNKFSVPLNPQDLTGTAAQLALGYALATGYANSEYGQNATINGMSAAEYYKQQTESFRGKTGMDAFNAISTMLQNMLNSDDYKKYYEACGEADVAGYVGALDAIKNNRETLESGNNVVNNKAGFSDENLGTILDALFGDGTK